MSTTKHTLSEWCVAERRDGLTVIRATHSTAGLGHPVGHTFNTEDAQRIVTAVNSHAELLAACKVLVKVQDAGVGMPFGYPELSAAVDLARAAIARAERRAK